jgi:hypothetical protein
MIKHQKPTEKNVEVLEMKIWLSKIHTIQKDYKSAL